MLPYDQLLMDRQMLEMDGYEATGQIRQREVLQAAHRLPIIAPTANAMEPATPSAAWPLAWTTTSANPSRPEALLDKLSQRPLHRTAATSAPAHTKEPARPHRTSQPCR